MKYAVIYIGQAAVDCITRGGGRYYPSIQARGGHRYNGSRRRVCCRLSLRTAGWTDRKGMPGSRTEGSSTMRRSDWQMFTVKELTNQRQEAFYR